MLEPCPGTEELTAYLLGRVAPMRSAAIGRHLDDCPACPARVGQLRLESRLMESLADRPPPEPPPPLNAALEELMLKLESLVPSHGSLGTPTPDSTTDEGFPFLTPADRPGDLGRLAEYRVVRILGSGGMGYVFQAEDTRLERLVGLKVLRPRANRDPAARARFLREARAMAAVKHDHIAVVHQVGETAPDSDGRPGIAFLAMEMLDGESLHDWMKKNPHPPVAIAIRLARQTAAGLAVAHESGLVHRDVKPSNLWLEAPHGWASVPPDDRPPLGAVGRVKLIDFGLAASTVGGPTEPSGPVGTPGYMAPEQLRGETLDGRCDLFALGCVLYELCTGEHPFPGRRLRGGAGGDPQPAAARDLNPKVPAALSNLIGRLLADDPRDRPASASEVERQLAALEATPVPPPRRWFVGLAAGAAVAAAVAVIAVVRPWNAPPSVTIVTESAEPDPWFPPGSPDAGWKKSLADLPSKLQFRAVAQKLAERNPGYDWPASLGWVEREGVLRFTVISDVVSDICPIRALADVRTVRISGTAPGKGTLTDIRPLSGMRLYGLILTNQPHLTDISPLTGMRLSSVELSRTGVRSLASLEPDLIEELRISDTPIRDLSPVKRMPKLRLLECEGCPASLAPLAGTSIVELKANVHPIKDAATLRKMPKLRTVNGQDIDKFWKSAETKISLR